MNAKICFPIAVSIGILTVFGFAGTRWRRFSRWTALGLIGQAASLQIINAGNLIHFQNYETFADQINKNGAFLLILILQGVIVLNGFKKNRVFIKKWLFENFRIRQIVCIGVFLFLSGAAVTPDLAVYGSSLLFAAIIQSINLANIMLIALSVPENPLEKFRLRLESFFAGKIKISSVSFEKFPVLAAAWIFLISAFLNVFVYERQAHVPDETQYLFQAKYLAAGQLTVNAPPVPEAFALYMIPERENQWFGIFSPAFPAMLAAGEKLNVIWLVNPVLAAGCVIIAYIFFRELYSKKFAAIAVFLLVCSPWFIFMAMSFMSHIFTLFGSLAAAVFLLKAFKKPNGIYIFAAGLMIGIVSLTRPLDGAVIAILLIFWTILQSVSIKTKILNSTVLTAGVLAAASLIFPYNRAVTGDALLLPMDFYYDKYFGKGVMSLGFGENRGLGWELDAFPGHSPLEAVLNASLNIFSVNIELFGWATGSLFLCVAFIFGGNNKKRDVWALVSLAVIVFAYSFYWYHGGPDFGARYWFLAIIPLVALTVRGLEFLSLTFEAGGKKQFNSRLVFAAGVLSLMSLVNYLPWRALDKYHNYLGIRPDIAAFAKSADLKNSLILIRGAESPDYQAAWIHNPLDFQADAPVFARDKNAEIRKKLLEKYAARKVWILNGPTVTGNGYEVVEKAIDAAELLNRENAKGDF